MRSPAFRIASTTAAAAALAAALAAQAIQINGAGATLPYPLYSKWFDEYGRQHAGIRINYQSVGSGAGIRQLIERTVFFGASDTPMTAAQLRRAPGSILHLPMVLGAVVPVYNLPTVKTSLKFSGAVLADIFLGRITRWNDGAIARLNPGVALSDADIVVVHRSEGSGTTFIWTDFLSKVSPDFRGRVGVSSAVSWPTGVGGKGSEGVTGLLTQLPGSIGYVELMYALQNRLSRGAVQNAAGEFVDASVESVTRAAAAASAAMPADFRVSITNPQTLGAYPVASFSWMLVYERPDNEPAAAAMAGFLEWALTEGQKYARDLGYAPLPADLVQRELAALKRFGTH
jgi:phosphate transport system substrate-binding protein